MKLPFRATLENILKITALSFIALTMVYLSYYNELFRGFAVLAFLMYILGAIVTFISVDKDGAGFEYLRFTYVYQIVNWFLGKLFGR
jgi:hypothetical protein